MSVITDARAELADLLGEATGAQAFPFLPERMTPPAVLVMPGVPYLTSEGTFGHFRAALDVYCVVPSRTNEPGVKALDQLIEDAVVALVNAGYSVSDASEPYAMSHGNASYLASTISTSQPVRL